MANSIFFHEDAYCQIELVPISNLIAKQQELKSVEKHFDENFTGDGFLNLYVREPTKHPLSDLNIRKADLENLLAEKALFTFDEVYSGYSSYRELRKNISGLGYENYVLYYSTDNNIITDIWLDYNWFSATFNNYPERLQDTLLKLGMVYETILIDWNEMIMINLKNENDVKNYFERIVL